MTDAKTFRSNSYNHYKRPELINGEITFTDVVETANNTLTLMTLEYIAKNHYKFEIKKQFSNFK